jgi:peptide/nickel transport system permease protein
MTGDWRHLLGTDHVGRDIFSRLMYGSRISLLVSVLAVLLAGGLGAPFGLVAGYYGGWFDTVAMRFADIQQAIPFLVLALALVAAFGNGLANVIAALGITGWVVYARVVRGEALSLRARQFVEAARAVGADDRRILWRHVWPNLQGGIVVVATLQISRMIIAEASLSFLGLGVDPQIPSWGRAVADGRDYLAFAWWVSTIPGLALMLTVLSVNVLGDWLRDRWDPRLRKE